MSSAADARIHAAFAPRVAILASPDIDEIARSNNVDHFAELLRPFEGASLNVKVRTSQLETRPCPVFHVRFDPLSSFTAGSTLGQRPEELLDAVGAHLTANSRRWLSDGKSMSRDDGSPWFSDFREMALGNRPVNRHESFSHPAADPMNAFAQLYELSCKSEAFGSRPYMDPNVLKYYVLLHDVSRNGKELTDSLGLLELVKKTYGLHCCILPINSHGDGNAAKSGDFSSMWARALNVDPRQPIRPPNIGTPREDPVALNLLDSGALSNDGGLIVAESAPPRWRTPGLEAGSQGTVQSEEETKQNSTINYGAMLSDDDVGRLKTFVRELTAQSLIPFMERCVVQWNEQHHVAALQVASLAQVASSLPRLSKVVQVLTPQDMTPAKDCESGACSACGNMLLTFFSKCPRSYPHASLEAQTRRLADFAFITRDYNLAASMYDICRRDFANDKAKTYWAGAMEMLGLSHILSTNSPYQPVEIDSCLLQACEEYESQGHGLESIRATLLYCEGYKRSPALFGLVPSALVRAASGAEEVFGALILERAAQCDLELQPPSYRKSAMHLTMSAHRYEDCGQKLLSLHCYDHAANFYRQQEWALLTDHVEYALGRQARIDGNTEKAAVHYASLLRRDLSGTAPHASYLDDLLTVLKFSSKTPEEEGLELPIQFFDPQRSQIRITNALSANHDNEDAWQNLEKSFLEVGFSRMNSRIERKRPLTLTNKDGENRAGTDEKVQIEIMAVNPLNTAIRLTNIQPLFTGTSSGTSTINEHSTLSLLDDLHLEPLQEKRISVSLSCRALGRMTVEAIGYRLGGAITIKQKLRKSGRRLNQTKAQRVDPSYAPDQSLTVTFVEPRPALEVDLLVPEDDTDRLGMGEEKNVRVRLTNAGGAMLSDLRLLIDRTESLQVLVDDPPSLNGALLVQANDLSPDGPHDVALPNDKLEPQSSIEMTFSVRGTMPGHMQSHCLFVFQSQSGEYFTARWSYSTFVEHVLDVAAHCRPSRAHLQTYSVSLEAANLLSTGPMIKIDAVSLISPRWEFADPTLQEADFDAIAPLQIGNGVVAVVSSPRSPSDILQASGQLPMDTMDYTVGQLRTLLLGRNVDRSSRPPPTSLLISRISALSKSSTSDTPPHSLTRFYRAARLSWRRHQLAARFSALKAEEVGHVFTMYEPQDVDLIIHWTSQDDAANGCPRTGQLTVFGLSLGPSHSYLRDLTDPESGTAIRSMYAETANEKAALLSNLLASRLNLEQDPLMIDAHVPRKVLHDFGSGPIRQKVDFVIQNLSPVRAAFFVIQLQSSSSLPRKTQDPSRVAPYVGRVTLRGHLAPLGSTRCMSHVLISEAGATELGGWKLRTTLLDASLGSDQGLKPITIFDSDMPTAGKLIQAVSTAKIEHPVSLQESQIGQTELLAA